MKDVLEMLKMGFEILRITAGLFWGPNAIPMLQAILAISIAGELLHIIVRAIRRR